MKLISGTILLVATGLFLLVNIASSNFIKSTRLDLTTNKIYTLSQGSKEIIKQLPEPVILRFYFSKKLAKPNPYLITFAARVQDLLAQYVRASNGKIILEVIDPEPNSTTENTAISYGLQSIPIDNTGKGLYLGLVGTSSTDVVKIIPFFQPAREANIEYDISQLIYNLVNPQPKTVGVISSVDKNLPLAIWQQIQQVFTLKNLDYNIDVIPADINTLMLVNPTAFPGETLRVIDNFVMRGGHVLAFVEPTTEINHELNALLKSWGVELLADKTVADRSLAKNVLIMQNQQEIMASYPLWIDCISKNLDQTDVITSALDRITLATPGVLNKTENPTTNFTPLISSTKDSMLVNMNKIPEYQENIDTLMNEYKPTGSYTLAGRVSGPIHSAYTDKQVSSSNIVIVADTDMLHDYFWVDAQNIPSSGNGSFVLNALDNLSGSDALIGIRNRGVFSRPFDKDIESLEIWVKFFSVGLIPLLIIIGGTLNLALQRRKYA